MKILLLLSFRALLVWAAFAVGLSIAAAESAVTAETKFIATKDGRQLAYRSVGEGPALVLCNRFRGTLDTWDPAFIDGLAEHFRVITFDFRGIGRSSGEAPTEIVEMAEDVKDVIAGLGLMVDGGDGRASARGETP